MTPILQPMVDEMHQEAATTRTILERVPANKLSWKPHPKSMSLGQLALHIAAIPEAIARLAQTDQFDAANATFHPPEPKDKQEILAALEAGVKTASAYLGGIDQSAASANWRMTSKGREVFAIPRVAMLRSIMFNHWYHHRGQLSVYLRLLDMPIPVIYGRSADENPFA